MKTRGAIYYNGFFPGFIGVVPNSVFLVHVNGTEVMLHIVRHVEPVVVTDFGNDFVPVEKAGKHFTALKRPIDSAPTNSRNATLHNGKEVEASDAELALNAVQQLIFAIDLPSWASFTSDSTNDQ